MRIPVLVACTGVLLVTVSATACQSKPTAASSPAATTAATALSASGGSPSSSAAATEAASSIAAAAEPRTGTGKLNALPAACPSAAEVMSYLQLSKLVLDGGDPGMCLYLYKGSRNAPYVVVTFNAAPGMPVSAFGAGLKKRQSNVQAVPNLADSAFSWGDSHGRGVSFLSGDIVSSILSVVPTTTAGEISLAKAILGG